MLVCPACGFQEEYQPGYRVGTLRPCGRCGLYSLLYLCEKCKTIGIRKSTVPTACSCGSMQKIIITSLDEECSTWAKLTAFGTLFLLVIGTLLLEENLSVLGDGTQELLEYFGLGRIIGFSFAIATNAGLAWVIARVVYRLKGSRFKKELSDSFDI